MKASKLIQLLKDHVKRHGDLEMHSTGGAIEVIRIEYNAHKGIYEYILADAEPQRVHSFERFPTCDD